MKPIFRTSYLFISGLTLITVGSYICLTPLTYLATFDSSRAISIELLSDFRGMGGMMVFLGAFIFISSFRKPLQQSALLVSTLIYTAFIFFRSIGFVIDGLPQTSLMLAYFIEVLLAMIGVLHLTYCKPRLSIGE